MKAILEFNLPEDEVEHKRALFADVVYSQMDEARLQCRNWLKYGHDFKTPDEAIEACRALLIFENPLELP
jgi:hypothetical protein